MRALLLSRYGDRAASSRVRYLQYIPYLEGQGVSFKIQPLFSNQYLTALYSGRRAGLEVLKGYLGRVAVLLRAQHYDALVIEKELFPFLPAGFERLLARLGVPYLVDYDDALFHRYDRHASPLVRGLLGRKIDAVMERAAVVVAGNEYLAERARSAGAREVTIVPSVVDTVRYVPATESFSGTMPMVGWIGTIWTSRYLAPLLPVFDRLQARYGVRFVAVGAKKADFIGTTVEVWPWSEESEVSSIQQFDVGIMPLEDSPWERGKCGYKLIQYMACGLPVVASPVGVNLEIVEEGENGFLASRPEEWERRLDQLIVGGQEQRACLGAAGRRRVEGWYSLEVQAPRVCAAIKQAAGCYVES